MTQDYGDVSSGSASTGSGVSDELSRDAAQLKDTAGQRIQQEADARKGQAAQIAGSASSALSKAASELEQDDNAPDWLSSAIRQAAGSIDRLAGEIDGRSVDQLGRQLTGFARSNPGTFLAAAAAAGFAAARVLRAGVEHRHHTQDSDVGGTGGSHGASSSTPNMGASTYGAPSSGASTGTGSGTGATTGSGFTETRPATASPTSTYGDTL